MADIVIRQGHDLRIVGNPSQNLADAPYPAIVGVRPGSIRGFGPRVLVNEGDRVLTGAPLLGDKKTPEIVVASPATGTVKEIRRGPRRALISVSIETEPTDEFVKHEPIDVAAADRQAIRARLLEAGLWPVVRQHPFAKIANPNDVPKAIFISAVETEPFAPDPVVVLSHDDGSFQVGLDAIGKLTDGAVHLTHYEGKSCPAIDNARNVQRHTVVGPHPAGSAPIHAFFIDRVKPGEVIWYLDVQHVQALGRLFRDGVVSSDRIITLAGNGVQAQHRQYFRTRAGIQLASLLATKLQKGEQRIVSGGLLTGERVSAEDFLGYYDMAVNVVPEGRRRELLGWLTPGGKKYSLSRAFSSALSPLDHKFEPDTNLNGGVRACIQSGYCLDVCPTDVKPLFVWKAVAAGDLEEADQLGILDCVDCGLCTFVCPSKIEIGTIIRQGLDQIEKEG